MVPSGCWIWIGALISTGYGAIRIRKKGVLVHRHEYEAKNGPIPKHLEIDHLCRERSCCNPEHLEAVEHIDNVYRGNSPVVDNAIKTHCLRGHPLYGPNLYLRKDRSGRECRACHKIRKRERETFLA